MDEPNRPDRSLRDQLTRPADHRIAPVREREGRAAAGSTRQRDEADGARQVGRDRLLEDEVLAGLEDGRRKLHVGAVRRADVDHVDAGVPKDRVEVGRWLQPAELLGPPLRSLRVGSDERDHVRVPGPARGVDVVRPDEARADDGDAESPGLAHRRSAGAPRSGTCERSARCGSRGGVFLRNGVDQPGRRALFDPALEHLEREELVDDHRRRPQHACEAGEG